MTALDLSKHPAGIVVANYARSAGWIEASELRQEAHLTMIECARTWNPERGPLPAYQARAVALHLRDYIAHQGRPVAFGIRHEAPAALGVELDDAMPAAPHHIEWRLDLARAAVEVNRILEGRPAARDVLLLERNQSDVARDHGLSRWQVVRETMAARAALRKSARLRELAAAL